MVCIYCSHKTRVTNSRTSPKSSSTWRRRNCSYCHATFTTKETVDYQTSIMVTDNKGGLAPFVEEKILLSIFNSLSHRKGFVEESSSLKNTIIYKIMTNANKGIVSKNELKQTIFDTLEKFDKPASIYYASHYMK